MDCLVENKAYPSSTGYNVRPRFTFSGDKNSASYYNKLEEVLKEMRLEDPIYFFKERVLSHMTVLHNILICLNYGVSYTDGGSIAISIENEAESDKSRVILTRYLYNYNIKGKLFGRSKSSILSISQLISMLNDAVSSSLDLTSVERSLYIDLIRIINGKYG